MKLIEKLDRWWVGRSSDRRIDRAPANLGLTVGLMCPALSIALRGPSPTSFIYHMPASTQIAMCSMIFAGLAICLVGMCQRSKWFYPNATLISCYQKGMYGGPLAFVGLAVYTFFLAAGTPNVWGTLNIFLTPCLGFAVAGQTLLYWLDIRRIRANEIAFTESAKIRAKIQDELSDDS